MSQKEARSVQAESEVAIAEVSRKQEYRQVTETYEGKTSLHEGGV